MTIDNSVTIDRILEHAIFLLLQKDFKINLREALLPRSGHFFVLDLLRNHNKINHVRASNDALKPYNIVQH